MHESSSHPVPIPPAEADAFDPASITRPDEALLTYFTIISAFTLIAFPFVFLPLYFKFKTLRYELDSEGVSMRWGLLWRQEINLTYRRIQDIHVTRGLIQRYLGLSSLSIQTASGSSGAEMTIIGIKNPETLRNFLYQKMRGIDSPSSSLTPEPTSLSSDTKIQSIPPASPTSSPTSSPISSLSTGSAMTDEALALLREIRDEIRSLHSDQPHSKFEESSS